MLPDFISGLVIANGVEKSVLLDFFQQHCANNRGTHAAFF